MTEDDRKERILDAALVHVPFDGWSQATLRAAAADSDTPLALATALYPRGGVDLALAYHARGNREMVRALASAPLSEMRIRDRIAHAVHLRLEAADRELVRRGTTLFALPIHAADGARAIWSTADAIWTAIGDTSEDFAWYSKRASLSAVYGATVLFWLGDDSPDHQATRDFLDRRIEGVMRFEKAKATCRKNPFGKAVMAGPLKIMERIRAPRMPQDLPGSSAN